MNRLSCCLLALGLGCSLVSWQAGAQADEQTGTISREVDPTKVIPIAITGLTGEAASALKFDLEVLGCQIVPESEATYTVNGTYQGRLEGFLYHTKSKTRLLGKAYSGGAARQAAHAFADDIIPIIRPGVSGVAQTRFAFKVERGEVREIYLSDYDGHQPVAVTHDQSNATAPSWRQNGNTLFYCSYKQGYPAIFSQELASGKRRMIAGYAGSNISPAVSRQGKVAMILSKSGNPNLYVADGDGTNLKQLTRSREGDSCPCWSPDGKTICFVSRVGGRANLYTIPAAGGPMQRLRTDGVLSATEPDWSPDGKSIVFTTLRGGFEICVVPAAGGTAETLVTGQDPAWAPNSRTVVFVRDLERGKGQLSLLDVPTKRTKDCALISGSASQPSWAR